MPVYVYFNAYQTGPSDDYQLTGSTATWIDNTDTSQFSAYTGDNQFWPSPDVRAQSLESQDFLICWCDNSVENSTSRDGVTSKVSYWLVGNSESDAVKLDWLNEAIRNAGGVPANTLANALVEAAKTTPGIWTNYNTDITVGEMN